MNTTLHNLVRTLVFAVAVVAATLTTPAGAVSCTSNEPLRGVNLAGAEFNGKRLPGVANKDYVYPDKAAFAHFAALGMNVVRLPFRWERIQPALYGELDSAETARLDAAVSDARSKGMCLILDVHNYGMYHGNEIGSAAVPVTAFVDLWKRLAARYGDTDGVALGLMNEPYKLSIGHWSGMAQLTVNALREAGARHLVLVSGGRWSGVHEWSKKIGATSNALAFARFEDPLKRTLIEVHQYADPHFSGTKKECVAAPELTSMFESISQWARANGQKLFLGEFGTPSTPGCLDALDAMLDAMGDKRAWRGWTYWAAGKWWGNYPLSIEPRAGQDAEQTAVLKRYL